VGLVIERRPEVFKGQRSIPLRKRMGRVFSQAPVSLSPKVKGPGFSGIFLRAFLQLAGSR